MKNTGTKTTILVASILFVIGAIVVFIRTIVAPPTKVEFVNQHQQVLDREISKFSGSKSMHYNDSMYDAIVDKIAVFSDNEFVSKAQSDNDKVKLVNAYVPLFKSHCLKDFQKSGWGESCFPPIRKRIKDLRSVKLTNRSLAVQGTNTSDLKEVEDIMNSYTSAKAISKIRSYKDIPTARRNINDAAKYLKMDYIKVSNLKDGLGKVKPRIAESHYKYILNQVNRLRNYRSMDEKDFESLLVSVTTIIKEYNTDKSIYDSYARDISSLNTEAGDIVSKARQYYASLKPSISVYTGGWQTYTDYSCPNGYTSYRSNLNFNTANGKATMSFTIKGYESFSLQVRCSSEICCDYLLVGDTNQSNVTESNCKLSTKDDANASYWQTVTYYNLNKSDTYTIYLVYKKDSSVNSGEDRAYVRIPNNK